MLAESDGLFTPIMLNCRIVSVILDNFEQFLLQNKLGMGPMGDSLSCLLHHVKLPRPIFVECNGTVSPILLTKFAQIRAKSTQLTSPIWTFLINERLST